MNTRANGPVSGRRAPLAACIAVLFGLTEPAAMAANLWTVTSCLDNGGADTLRGVIGAISTVSGDIVSLDGLNCPNSTITLYSGYAGIAIPQDSLKIYGPTSGTLTIDASGLDPTTYAAFYHTGTGTLTITHLTISGGAVNRQGSAPGGCIYSRGSVSLLGATVSGCSALSDGPALGGGVYAKGNVFVAFSKVSGNTASGTGTYGGGVFAKGIVELYFGNVSGNSAAGAAGAARCGGVCGNDVVSLYGTISGNHVTAPGLAAGGGFAAKGTATLRSSTLSGNTSGASAGGALVAGAFSMYNSTISGNSAVTDAGALYLQFNSFFYNSTIAFNTSTAGTPGVLLHPTNVIDVVLQSTLMSNNSSGASDDDLAAVNEPLITFNGAPANNLVRVTGLTGLPADTKTGTCPLLGPLRDNGGLTRTHQLLSKSVAIDAGNDVTIDPITHLPFADDQRGSALANGTIDYVRVSGAQADIGAYEVQQNDVVFDAGFDGCNPAGP